MAKKSKTAQKSDQDQSATLAVNRRARFDYEIIESVEAGLVLTGTEIKSLREGTGSIAEAYARIRDGEMWLFNMHIPPYAPARENHEPRRARKLLMHRRQIEEGCHALLEAERRSIHVAEGNGTRLIDVRLFQLSGAGGTQRDNQVWQPAPAGKLRQRMRCGDRRLDRADAGDERFETAAQMLAVLGLDGHDEQDRLTAVAKQFHRIASTLPIASLIARGSFQANVECGPKGLPAQLSMTIAPLSRVAKATQAA